jgi:hypothetical protein
MSDQKPRCPFSYGEVGVVCFTVVYMAVSLIVCLMRKNPEFIFYLVVMCVLIAAVTSVHLKVGLHIGALWGLSIWGLAHMAGGLMPVPLSWPKHGDTPVLYNLWLIPKFLKYDQLVHAYGFGLVTWICWQGIRSAFSKHDVDAKPTLGLMTLCVAGGMGFGAANEIVEFIATITMPGTNVGGYDNTGWDLVANFVGCVLSAIIIFYRYGNHKFSASSVP